MISPSTGYFQNTSQHQKYESPNHLKSDNSRSTTITTVKDNQDGLHLKGVVQLPQIS